MIRTVMLAFSLALSVFAVSASAQDGQDQDAQAKRIALTFDDVPRGEGGFFTSEERTRAIINRLRDAGAEQAVFFVNPGRIAKRPGAEERIAAYVAAGHVIANHTNNHPRLSQTDTDTYIADLDHAAQWLKDREGARPWFRFPFLDEGRSDTVKRDAMRGALRERGLLNASPTVDASDWWQEAQLAKVERERRAYSPPGARDLFIETHVEAAEFYHALALRTFGRPIAHNMLLHETDLSAMWIGDLIAALREAGWTIITADEAFADPVYKTKPDVPSAQGTLVELAAWERGIKPPRWYEGNNTAVLEGWFNTRVLGQEDDQGEEQ